MGVLGAKKQQEHKDLKQSREARRDFFGAFAVEKLQKHREMKQSGARSAPGFFGVLEAKAAKMEKEAEVEGFLKRFLKNLLVEKLKNLLVEKTWKFPSPGCDSSWDTVVPTVVTPPRAMV